LNVQESLPAGISSHRQPTTSLPDSLGALSGVTRQLAEIPGLLAGRDFSEISSNFFSSSHDVMVQES